MSQFSDSMRAQLQAYRGRVVHQAPSGIQYVLNADLVPFLRRFGPGTNRPVHLYSLGRTQSLYGVKKTDHGAQVFNTRSKKGRDVSGYIDHGATRAWPVRARSFRIRSIGTTYTHRAFQTRKEQLERQLANWLNKRV